MMHTEVEHAVEIDKPGQAVTIWPCTDEQHAREMAEAYRAIHVNALAVHRLVTYEPWLT